MNILHFLLFSKPLNAPSSLSPPSYHTPAYESENDLYQLCGSLLGPLDLCFPLFKFFLFPLWSWWIIHVFEIVSEATASREKFPWQGTLWLAYRATSPSLIPFQPCNLHTLVRVCNPSVQPDGFCNAPDTSATFIFMTRIKGSIWHPCNLEEGKRERREEATL